MNKNNKYNKKQQIGTITRYNNRQIKRLPKKIFCYGGMPRAVRTWLLKRILNQLKECRRELLEAYERDFSKHTDSSTATKIQYVWNSITITTSKRK